MGRQLRWATVATLGLWAGIGNAGGGLSSIPTNKLIGTLHPMTVSAMVNGNRILPQR